MLRTINKSKHFLDGKDLDNKCWNLGEKVLCRIYIEAKEAVLGGPDSRAPQIYKKNGCGITITRRAFNKILTKLWL